MSHEKDDRELETWRGEWHALGGKDDLAAELVARAARDGKRMRHAALREVARRSANWAFGQNENMAVDGRGERTKEAGDPSSHDDQVIAVSRVHPRSASSVW